MGMNKREINKIMAKAEKFPTKVELTAQTVELTLIDDFKKAIGDAKGILKTIESSGASADKYYTEILQLEKELTALKKSFTKDQKLMEKAMDAGDKVEERLANISDKLEASAKDFGISPKDIDGYSELVAVSKGFKDAYSKYNKLTTFTYQ